MVEILGMNNSSIYTDAVSHFSWSTFIISVSVALLTSFIVPMYIKPYFDTKTIFKQYLIETWTHLRFFSSIYMLSIKSDNIRRPKFFEEVLMMKDELRKHWVDLEKSYYLIPKPYKWYLIKKKYIPGSKEFSDICSDIRAISNSPIIYNSEIYYKIREETDLKTRVETINRINFFISKYTEMEYTEIEFTV